MEENQPEADRHLSAPVFGSHEHEHSGSDRADTHPTFGSFTDTASSSSPIPSPAPTAYSDPVPPLSPPSGVSRGQEENGLEAIDPDHPLPVTAVYSTYGMEYLIMLISLAIAAFSLGSLLDSVVDLAMNNSPGLIGSLLNSYAEAALIVSFPIFAFLFLRLESKEESDPSLLTDSSRRRGMQIALVISFILALSGLIGYLNSFLSKNIANQLSSGFTSSGYGGSSSGFANFLHALIAVVIAGGIFGYYWYKLHKKPKRNAL